MSQFLGNTPKSGHDDKIIEQYNQLYDLIGNGKMLKAWEKLSNDHSLTEIIELSIERIHTEIDNMEMELTDQNTLVRYMKLKKMIGNSCLLQMWEEWADDNDVSNVIQILNKKRFTAHTLFVFLKELKRNKVNLKNVEVNFRIDDNSDVIQVSKVEQDLFDEETNTIPISISLLQK